MKQIVKKYMDCDDRKTAANSSCIIAMVRVLYNVANIYCFGGEGWKILRKKEMKTQTNKKHDQYYL